MPVVRTARDLGALIRDRRRAIGLTQSAASTARAVLIEDGIESPLVESLADDLAATARARHQLLEGSSAA